MSSARRSRPRSPSAGHLLRGSALEARLRSRGDRRHDARSADPSRRSPPDPGDDRRDCPRLRPVRLRRLRGPGGRGRPHELPDAQHPAGPPRPGPVGHAVRRRRGPSSADPHVARPDPGHAPGEAADPGAAARPLLPLRGDRRQPRVGVLPGRGPDGRRGHDDGRPQGPARPIREGRLRRRQEDALPARATTRSRSRRSRSTSSASSVAGRAVRRARGRAG